jgi:hypothetical protein
VHVPAFVNRTGEPQLETVTTSATIREFQRDGTLRVSDAGSADLVLTATLKGFALEPLRFERDRAKTAREYRVRITAHIVFAKPGSDEALVDKTVQGEATFILSGDITSAKRSALPEAARDLAHDIVESIVEYW